MSSGPQRLLSLLLAAAVLCAPGCAFVFPDVTHQPVLHNPFPQLSRVAVAPFFNQSDEPTVDGRAFAMAYFTELQDTPGYEVVPVGVVEQVMINAGVNLANPGEARRLAQLLGVDALVVGAVTDYSPYYPPRCGMRIEWYAANAGFHAIPAGYNLPWGTPLEEYIPDELVFEAEMALAKAQLATQTPDDSGLPRPLPPAMTEGSASSMDDPPGPTEPLPMPSADGSGTKPPAPAPGATDAEVTTGASMPIETDGVATGEPPTGWPDPRGFSPPGPQPYRPPLRPTDGPVMTHTRVYRGNDPEFTSALASYVSFRDEARFGGWQSYLERSDDFIRFCCHLHLAEMLTARGGGGETRVVRR